MADSGNGHDKLGDESFMEEQEEQNAQLNLLAQYVKDLSFESPNSPESLKGPGANPNIEIGINVSPKKVGEDTFEVALEFNADAKNDTGYIYKLEVVYAGLFALKSIPEKLLQPVLFVDCPTLVFPFLRHIVYQMSQEGGFPPLQLDPIDFGGLFREKIKEAQNQEEPVIN